MRASRSPFRYPPLERLRQQIDQLDWLLRTNEVDPKDWRLSVTAEEEDGDLALGLYLERRTNISFDLLALPRPEDHEGRHFYIEGNHHYDQFAVSALERALHPDEEEQGEEDEDDEEDEENADG